jgi:two-component system, NtrC family, response regulator AtoC
MTIKIEKVLVVDDEIIMRNFLSEALKRKGIDVTTVETGQKAFGIIEEGSFDMVITDMKMPGITGMDVVRKVKELSPNTLVIVITAHGTIENAIEAMRAGAFDYMIKPFSIENLIAIIEKAQTHVSLVEENLYLRQQISSGSRPHRKMIAESPTMRKILSDIEQIAKSNASVFINGESGTGKEVVAQAVHYSSPRVNNPFIKVNCAAVPETLVESEFFGHEKGAFTGANAKRLGRFELANGGSLLLDEITEIPIGLQAKLLRVIQEHEFERVGGSKSVKVDVRLISTSNRNMKEAITNKVLREDLYYRLNVIPIFIPPLRERREDILPLAEYFIERMCQENHTEKKKLTPEAKKKLVDYSWPGNIRELSNVIERAIVMDATPLIGVEYLYLDGILLKDVKHEQMTLEDLEKKHIIETLQCHENNPDKAAETLGITLRMLRSKLSTYNLIDK